MAALVVQYQTATGLTRWRGGRRVGDASSCVLVLTAPRRRRDSDAAHLPWQFGSLGGQLESISEQNRDRGIAAVGEAGVRSAAPEPEQDFLGFAADNCVGAAA